MGKTRINDLAVTGDGDDASQAAIGNTVGGNVVQSGQGAQLAAGNVIAGDLVQDGGGDEG